MAADCFEYANNQLKAMSETNSPAARINKTKEYFKDHPRQLDTARNANQAIGLVRRMAGQARAVGKRKAEAEAAGEGEPAAPPVGDVQQQQAKKMEREARKKRRRKKTPSPPEPDTKQHQPSGATDVANSGNGKSWLRVVKVCCFCNELKKVGDGGTEEVARCCAWKVCKQGMHSSCWEKAGGDPLPLDDKGKSVFWSCADLDAVILPWKSRCKTLLPVPGVGRA